MRIRPRDIFLTILLVALFAALAALTPDHDPSEILLILFLGALQITELRLIPLETTRSKVIWNVVKLAAGYALIGYTQGLPSPYYWVLLFPVMSAAATLGVIGTLAFTGAACGAYLSFLLYVDWTRFDIPREEVNELIRRLLFLAISGLLVRTLAEKLREQSVRYKALADELALANRNLQEAKGQVLRAQRLAALGQLTAGLAHEMRNPLGTIKGSADMLRQNLPANDPIARELSGYISSEVDRTNSLIGRFLEFARPLELRVAPANLEDALADAARATARDANERTVALDLSAARTPIRFAFDSELLERVFVNLFLNAIQASPSGGTVTVAAEMRDGAAVVEVTDHGLGIPEDRLESIFNPFFTTKSNGTGLGLAIVAKIVDEHGGTINVSSVPNQKTVFTVTLPVARASSIEA